MADDQSSYPVLMQSQSGFPPLLLAAVAEELASHGYVVVGVNHTYEPAVTVFADGRAVAVNPDAVAGVLGPQTGPYQERFRQRAAVCDYKAADLASVADQLEQLPAEAAGLLGGRLDLDRLGAFGHFFGGNAALQWCRDDRRCRAAANLDGALWTEVGRCRPRVPSGRCWPRPPSTRDGCGGSPATCSWPSSQPTSTRNRHRPCSRSRR
jgi:dienelactone hydrolase